MEVVELASARACQIMEGSYVVWSNLVKILTLIDNITPTIVVIELASARCTPEVGSKGVGSKHASHCGLGQCAGWGYSD